MLAIKGVWVANNVFLRMHTIKGCRVVQTFALSSSSDSGGKKSRIRRSKEERKTMVESFIKNYQTLNNGNFPSLNLTHKEVGGSFYTVREIVREIIQENRVLGPAMLTLEDDNKNDIMQHFPVGTIAVQPLICSPSGYVLRHDEPKQYQGEKGEYILTPNEQEIEHHFEDIKKNEYCTTELAFDHNQGVDSELISNSVGQFSVIEHPIIEHVKAGDDSMVVKEVGRSDEQVLVTPRSVSHEDVNQESHQNTIAEQVLVTPRSAHHEDINQESHQSTISEQVLGTRSVHHEDINQESHQSTISEQVLGTRSVHHEDINQESHQNTMAEQIKHAEKDHLGSIQASEKAGDFSEPLHIDTVVEDCPVALKQQSNELSTSLPRNNAKPEVVVETFPPIPVTQTRTINGFEGKQDKHHLPDETENDLESENKLGNISSVVNVDVGAELGRSTSEKVDGSLDAKASPSNGYFSSEISESLTANETLVADGKNVVVINEEEVLSIGKLVNAPKDINENIDSLDNKTPHQQIATDTKIEPSIVDHSSSGSNMKHSTLDRTKLETWEGTSEKKPAATEIDSLVALFKAFLVALVKFITK